MKADEISEELHSAVELTLEKRRFGIRASKIFENGYQKVIDKCENSTQLFLEYWNEHIIVKCHLHLLGDDGER